MRKQKRSFRIILCVLAVIAFIHIADFLLNGHNVEYAEYVYLSGSVPETLDGYVFALVVDLHSISEKELRDVAVHIGERGVSALFLAGDYAPGGGVGMNMRVLGALKPRDGIYGVEGNHDYWPETVRAMKENGIVPLDNTGAAPAEGLYVAGVQDLWNRTPDVVKAAQGSQQGDFVVLLSHNPDVTMEQDMSSVNLTLSGHTHGGQISFFGLWPPAIYAVTKYGDLFTGGYVKTPRGDDVIVSRGTGNHLYIPRVFARPQVCFITLRHAA